MNLRISKCSLRISVCIASGRCASNISQQSSLCAEKSARNLFPLYVESGLFGGFRYIFWIKRDAVENKTFRARQGSKKTVLHRTFGKTNRSTRSLLCTQRRLLGMCNELDLCRQGVTKHVEINIFVRESLGHSRTLISPAPIAQTENPSSSPPRQRGGCPRLFERLLPNLGKTKKLQGGTSTHNVRLAAKSPRVSRLIANKYVSKINQHHIRRLKACIESFSLAYRGPTKRAMSGHAVDKRVPRVVRF